MKKREKTRKKSNKQKMIRDKVREFKAKFGEAGHPVDGQLRERLEQAKPEEKTLKTSANEEVRVSVSFL